MKAVENDFTPGTRFHHISTKCADSGRSRDFYTGTLGMNAVLQWEEGDQFYSRSPEAGCRGIIEPGDVAIEVAEGKLPVRIAFIYSPDNEYTELFQYC